jgi:polyisoprenyl-teichoic acid--peptidoglycan teichoic acid transferase
VIESPRRRGGWLTPKSRTGVVWRMLLAGLILVACAAGTTATAGLLEVKTLVGYISVHPGVKVKQLQLPKPGKPQTILLIGSDHRFGESFSESNTDTMLLMRLNASSHTINVMSIPRDLEVDIPGYGTSKINAAYSLGGYGLLLKTIKADVFPKLKVNHIIDTNFTGFSDIIDAIGCVYSDVDHRYYNDTALTGYSSIDIQPGYQKLCGHNQSVHGALPFVRFRHTDTDIVRNARQQDFLRWAKDQFPASQILSQRKKLLKIFGEHSTLDKNLQSTQGLLDLFDLFINADGSAIKQIPFPAILPGPTADGAPSYVTAESSAEAAAYAQFMHATKAPKVTHHKPSGGGGGHGKKHKRRLDTTGLIADPGDGITQAKALDHVKMPVYYPRYILDQGGYCFSITGNCDEGDEPASEYEHSYPRQYRIPIRGEHGAFAPAYRMTLYINALLGQYYGIQGVKWKNPPLLDSPSGTRVVNGRKLFLYADGGKLTTVAWHLGPYTYWVSNDLTSTIPNHQLVNIAASMVRYRG